jgi:hypothetical protein
MNRKADRLTDRQTDRQTDEQGDRQTDGHVNSQAAWQTHKQADRQMEKTLIFIENKIHQCKVIRNLKFLILQWGSVTHQVAVPVPSISCRILNHHNLFYQIQNALAFNWDTCCNLAHCLRLLPFHCKKLLNHPRPNFFDMKFQKLRVHQVLRLIWLVT